MPWKPRTDERPPRDERVEACRDRAAHLCSDDGREATLYCRVDTWWAQIGGHLWWRRWSLPEWGLETHWLEEGRWVDFLSVGEGLETTLADFGRGIFVLQGERWHVQWLSEEDSRAFRQEHGFESCVPDSGVAPGPSSS